MSDKSGLKTMSLELNTPLEVKNTFDGHVGRHRVSGKLPKDDSLPLIGL